MSKVAVVEDNPDNRLLVRAFLRAEHEIVEYENGSAALAGLAAERPDVVLLDISLPGLDGLAVLGAMRADPALRSIPVIALTAHAMEEDRERFLAEGFDDYIAKPITDENLLLEAIRRLVKR